MAGIDMTWGFFPMQNTGLQGNPMWEHQVPLPQKKASAKKKKTVSLPTEPPRPNIFTLNAGDLRQPIQQVPGPDYSVGAEAEGPATDESAVLQPLPTEPETETEGERAWRTGQKSGALYDFIRPEESELEAARNGRRWHWALQNRWMLPGTKWNETVWQGVDRENADMRNALTARGQDLKQITQPVATAREKANMLNMWKTFLTDIKNGNFDNYGGTTETVEKWANEFKKHFEEKFGEGSSVELAPLPDVLGKRTELARKSLVDLRTNIDDTEFAVDQLNRWLENGDFNSEEGQQRITRILDKVGQSFTARLGGDSKNMADAEKVRIQIQYLPPAGKAQVYDTIRKYRDALVAIATSSSNKEWTQNNWGKINEIKGSEPNDDRTAVSTLTAIGDLVTQRGLDGTLELPHDVATALQTNKELFENYMQSMVLAANVAPLVVYDFAKYLHDQSANSYNDLAKQFGRIERAGELAPVNEKALANIIPADPLLESPNFVGPTSAKRPTGDNSSNPQTGKEGNRKYTVDDEGGIG